MARDPETGGRAKARGSLQTARGVPSHAPQPTAPINVPLLADPEPDSLPSSSPDLVPGPSEKESFTDAARTVSVKNAGLDPVTGKVIPHKPTSRVRALVSRMVATGLDENEIAVTLNIRPGQLRQHYGRELAYGKAEIDAAVGGAIINRAVKGDPRMAIFYAKAKMGWRDGDSKPVDVSPLNLHIHL